MKRNFAVGLFGGLIGSAMLLIVLSATGSVGARSSAVLRSGVAQVKAVAASPTLTSTFTYQGRLSSNDGSVISTTCDFQFALYDALTGGLRVGLTQTVGSVNVNRGLFTALLNASNEFGSAAFNGNARWLQIAVACPPTGYTPLSPRQALTSLPFALPGLRTFPNAISPNIVGGFSGNTIISSAVGSTIAGGGAGLITPNVITNSYAFIGGGRGNYVRGQEASIGGGNVNRANGDYSAVGGGSYNQADGLGSAVGGGSYNQATSDSGAVSGGYNNAAHGAYAFIGGGKSNFTNADYATIPGGSSNFVLGDYALAAGRQAHAVNTGAFVWGDSTAADVESTRDNQFVIRASGGVSLSVNAGALTPIDVGERYRDNAIIAWADIAADGTLSGEFGVTAVSHSTGIYTITLDAAAVNSFTLVPIAIAEVDAPPTSAGSARLLTINLISPNSFAVYITNGSYTLVDNQFVFMATAR